MGVREMLLMEERSMGEVVGGDGEVEVMRRMTQ